MSPYVKYVNYMSNMYNMSNMQLLLRYAQYVIYAQYAKYAKQSLIGSQNRQPGLASSLPATWCHENRLVVVLSVLRG